MTASNADRLSRWQRQIEHSRKWREDERYDETWRRLVDLYALRPFEDVYMEDMDRVAIHMAFSTINVIWPAVSVSHPKITVTAQSDEHAAQGIITEAVVNYLWRRYRFQPEFRRSAKDFLIVGHGWLKVGWKFEEEERERDEESMRSEFEEKMGQIDQAILDSPDMLNDMPSPEDVQAAIPNRVMVTLADHPFVNRVSPHDVFVNPDATCMEDIRWIAQRIYTPLDKARNNTLWSKTERMKLASTKGGKDRGRSDEKDRRRDETQQYVTVWEFYDMDSRTMAVFADGSEGFLVRPQEMPYAFGHPFVMLRNYDVPDQFYPLGELEAIEPLQHELNITRSQMLNDRKRWRRKWLYKRDSFDIDGIDALESDNENVLVPVIGDEPLPSVIAPMPVSALPPDFYNQSGMIAQDINVVSGVSDYSRGSMPEIRRTATEASIIQDSANSRAKDKLDEIERAAALVAERVIQLCQQFMTGEHVARITGPEGSDMWFTYDRDYIAGSYDFSVEAGSTQPNNESFRRQSAMQLMDAMAPLVQMGVVNPTALAEHVLRNGFGVRNPQQFLAPPPMPDPMQEAGQVMQP